MAIERPKTVCYIALNSALYTVLLWVLADHCSNKYIILRIITDTSATFEELVTTSAMCPGIPDTMQLKQELTKTCKLWLKDKWIHKKRKKKKKKGSAKKVGKMHFSVYYDVTKSY